MAESERGEKISTVPVPRSINVLVDGFFFVYGAAAAVWLAVLAITETFDWGWYVVLIFVLFWALLAYLILPRVHRIMTSIYVPDYFIGRTRTSDGLLGDPINVAVRGSEAQIDETMREAGWTRADPVSLRSAWRTIVATVLRRPYDEQPMSPLLLFGRTQDLAFQKDTAGNTSRRHHVRFWRCPEGWLLPGGVQVDWLAAGTFDRRLGFSLFTFQITHKVDKNTDIERDYIVDSLDRSSANTSLEWIRDFSSGYHSRNGGGDSIETDGNLPIVDLTKVELDVRSPEDKASDDAAAEARRARLLRRPGATVTGVALLLVRSLGGVVFLLTLALNWDHSIIGRFGRAFTNQPRESVHQLTLAIGAAATTVYLLAIVANVLLAILIARRSNWARVSAMTLSGVTVLIAFIDWVTGGPQLVLRANLLGLPLDILIICALSSPAARRWARLAHPSRRLARMGLNPVA